MANLELAFCVSSILFTRDVFSIKNPTHTLSFVLFLSYTKTRRQFYLGAMYPCIAIGHASHPIAMRFYIFYNPVSWRMVTTASKEIFSPTCPHYTAVFLTSTCLQTQTTPCAPTMLVAFSLMVTTSYPKCEAGLCYNATVLKPAQWGMPVLRLT